MPCYLAVATTAMSRTLPEAAMGETDGMHNSAYWRDRAGEVRTKADAMRDVDAKQSMLEMARVYDRMADRAALREAIPTE
ncbi:hypothetical protein SAMN02990966_06119 [Rhodospirillales bacterium URHD0017]|nr:hypothetical protein SAMN02990966_06119 [Rhodospirillales bacterium URHD0017]